MPDTFRKASKGVTPTANEEALQEPAIDPILALSTGLTLGPVSALKGVFQQAALGQVPAVYGLVRDKIAQSYGFDNSGIMDMALQQSKLAPLETIGNKSSDISSPFSSMSGVVNPDPFERGVSAIANRYPKLFGDLARRPSLGPEKTFMADASHSPSENMINIGSHLEENFPELLKYAGLQPQQKAEYIASVMEHELTHKAQHVLKDKGLAKTFGITKDTIEPQAYKRGSNLINKMIDQTKLQERINSIPNNVKNLFARLGSVLEEE